MRLHRAVVLGLVCSLTAHAWPGFAEKVEIGPHQSRAVWMPGRGSKSAHPVVILVPGSGANGPEEAIPGAMTTDGRDTKVFESIAESFSRAGFSVLALGKPGVEFFSSFDRSTWFYDEPLYRSLRWSDLLDNVDAGVKFVRGQRGVDSSKIYLLGHSQGTQVVSDYASAHSELAGLFLLGYSDISLKQILEWQIYVRPFDYFVKTDVDLDRDGFISKHEAVAMWKQLETSEWKSDFAGCLWDMSREEMSIVEMQARARACPAYQGLLKQFEQSPLESGDQFNRAPYHDQVAALAMDVYSFTGELDVQTPVSDALALRSACERAGKVNCHIEIVPGVGHAFSPPKGPRAHPLLDMTLGAPVRSFLERLSCVVQKL